MTQQRRRTGLVLLVSLIIAVWLAVMVWIALQPQRADGSLGIDDQTDDGAAALTSVLTDYGIAVRPAQSMTQLRSELQRHPDATVLFHDKYQAMSSASYERLAELAQLVPAEQRVFAGVTDSQQLDLVSGVYETRNVGFVEHLEAGPSCQLGAAQEADAIGGFRQGVVIDDDALGCFAVVDDSTGQSEPAYAFAESTEGSIIFADWRMLSNAGLYDNGTATLALWTLGRADTVIWFQPDFQFDPDTDGKLSPVQLPDWARMGIVWAVIVTGIWLFYRGRRTGPVIVEPLPAEVPAAETTVGRGRMYAKTKQRRHALGTIQQASLACLARLLRLGVQASPDAILHETASQLAMPRTDVQRLYTPPTDQLSTHEFVAWANQLQDLEHQVRDRLSTPTKESS
ncbi:hypothetical protein [Enteractinococcus coprophilus]|uniref:DUF4350 domain-containing protein n=1 Tax=Enteractinococcus coprophilus TaxID=1027633 RepID=A0A542ZZY9_9MICC|nr:hypothetical protein [Enteractinococcus coprophilus]TQL65912.1 hypothetical protein FB556_2387 [Enteractinococcus coprophilus]